MRISASFLRVVVLRFAGSRESAEAGGAEGDKVNEPK